jgi:hypothetical protein
VSRLGAHFRQSVETAARQRQGHPLRGSPLLIGIAMLVAAYSLWDLVDATGWQRLRVALTLVCVILVVVFQLAVRRQIQRETRER